MSTPVTSRTSVTHTCPGGCSRHVPSHHFACSPCWFRLPFPIRKRIRDHYRRDPAAHFAAMSDAMAWYAANPLPNQPEVTALNDASIDRDHVVAALQGSSSQDQILELQAEVEQLCGQLARARAARADGRQVAVVELVRILHTTRSDTETVSDAWRAGRDSVLGPIRKRIKELRGAADG